MNKFYFLFILLINQSVFGQLVCIDVNSNWQFRQEGDNTWMKAVVPGSVHTDLLANGKIPDPFFGNNEPKLLWIEKENWEYETRFNIDPAIFSKHHIDLIFQGLDTYAEVYLNGNLILEADNMFRSWSVEIKRLAQLRDNILTIRFASAQNRVDSIACSKLPFVLNDNAGVYARKAQYQFGWDWGPKFTTCGVWRPIQIQGWDEVKIEDVFIKEIVFDTVKKGNEQYPVASILAEISINSQSDKSYNIFLSDGRLKLEGRKSPLLNDVRADILSRNFIEVFERVMVKKGLNKYLVAFGIRNPERWWCNGLGKPTMYHLSCELFNATDAYAPPIVSKIIPFAIRTIELVHDPDVSAPAMEAAAGGHSKHSYFKLNGVPVFVKGANYIPQSPFPGSITKDDYRNIITSAKQSNMNMLRVWGGGVYEDDYFYDLCDEFGILVWQDMMFTGTMHPGDQAFLKNIGEELKENIIRLRNHPSIALWCGNTENRKASVNQGLQKQYNLHGKDSATVCDYYKALFDTLAPSVLADHDPSKIYWPSSTSLGWGKKASHNPDDSQETAKDFDLEPGEGHTGYFMSAYGIQSLPSWSTIESFTSVEDRDTSSEVMKVHQKNVTGYFNLGNDIDRYFKVPKDFASYAYVSQCLQALALKNSIEKHRTMMPYCMGTLYGQLNDCWPVTSWSTIDNNGNWKAAQYAVKRAYQDVFAAVSKQGKNYNIIVINDSQEPVSQQLRLTLYDFEGNTYWQKTLAITDMAHGIHSLAGIDSAELFKQLSAAEAVLKMEMLDSLSADGGYQTNNLYYFTRPKDALLQKPAIRFRIVDADHVEVSTDVLARYVCLSVPGNETIFDDNYFDLLPGDSKIISIKTRRPVKNILKQIQAKSLADSFNPPGVPAAGTAVNNEKAPEYPGP